MSTPDTYSLLITIHSASNVPAADFHNLSADPYVLATISAPSRPHPPEEPILRWRTPTVRCTRDPVWNNKWIVAGAPQDGFKLKLSVVDEDVKDRDDRLGRAKVIFTSDMMHEGFEFREKAFKVKKRRGSIVPYILTYFEGVIPGHHVRKHNRIVLSVKVVGKTRVKENDLRAHTIGPNAYSLHFSSLIGSVINRGNRAIKGQPSQQTGDKKKRASASSFVACKLQLTGPVPKELHHHYVGYNWFIKMLYARRGLSGRILFQGLRKQYRTVYSYNKSTLYGVIETEDDAVSGSSRSSEELEAHSWAFAKQFLKMTNYGRGGRLQTYVLTLDAQWRFCETGDEFAIDFLSKHMMHADGEQIVAYAGEFFVRRIAEGAGEGEQIRGHDTMNKDPRDADDENDDEPSHYELVIDNDSGTYRPPESTVPILQAWLADKRRLGALGRVTTMHCSDDKLQALKKQRKEIKKRLAGGVVSKRHQVRRAGSSASSIRIDGRKLSSGEIEGITAEHEKENERKLQDKLSQEQEHRNQEHHIGSGQKTEEKGIDTPPDSGISIR